VTFLLRGVPAYRARSYAALERVARDVRDRVSPDTAVDEPLDSISLFERLDEYSVKVRGKSISLTYEVKNMPPGLEANARYVPEERLIVVALDQATYDELLRNGPRAVFTLAHEIGHAVLHTEELVDRALNPPDLSAMNRAQPTHKPYLDTEWQANGFAAALLMPARGLYALEERGGDLDAYVISEQYAVSMPAAEVRLKTYQSRKRQLI
jgi:hypothetical protein